MKTHKLYLLLPFAFVLLITGCAQEEMGSVQTVTSGPYQIEIQAPGGILKSGENPIAVKVSQNGQLVEAEAAELMFSMPGMGAMPYMEMHAQFSPPATEGSMDGSINFSMGGSWNGKVQVTTPNGPVEGTFQLHVEERH